MSICLVNEMKTAIRKTDAKPFPWKGSNNTALGFALSVKIPKYGYHRCEEIGKKVLGKELLDDTPMTDEQAWDLFDRMGFQGKDLREAAELKPFPWKDQNLKNTVLGFARSIKTKFDFDEFEDRYKEMSGETPYDDDPISDVFAWDILGHLGKSRKDLFENRADIHNDLEKEIDNRLSKGEGGN